MMRVVQEKVRAMKAAQERMRVMRTQHRVQMKRVRQKMTVRTSNLSVMAVWQSYSASVHSNLHDVVVILTILNETVS